MPKWYNCSPLTPVSAIGTLVALVLCLGGGLFLGHHVAQREQAQVYEANVQLAAQYLDASNTTRDTFGVWLAKQPLPKNGILNGSFVEFPTTPVALPVAGLFLAILACLHAPPLLRWLRIRRKLKTVPANWREYAEPAPLKAARIDF
jgi:hypothetical protein